jgi:hypothetical protein
VLVAVMALLMNQKDAIHYLEAQNFTEPLFVFAILVVAGTRPVLWAVQAFVSRIARALPLNTQLASYFLCLSLVPLLGSFITEPAAMTLAALMLRDRFYSQAISERMKYLDIRCVIRQYFYRRHTHFVCCSTGIDGCRKMGMG